MDSPIIKNLVEALGLSKLPPEVQEETLVRVGNIIFQNVMIRVLDSMTEEEQKEFDKLITERPDDQEAIYNYLKNKVPDFDTVVAEEVEKFRTEAQELLPKA